MPNHQKYSTQELEACWLKRFCRLYRREAVFVGQFGLLELNSVDAFIFSEVTGAPYLESFDRFFTPKGLCKLYNKVFSTEPIVGLYEQGQPKYTPKILSMKRPYLFDGNKFVAFIAAYTYSEFISRSSKLRDSFKDGEVLVYWIELSKKGQGVEPLLELAIGLIFRDRGYLVECQVPLSYRFGSPDLQAIKIDSKVSSQGFFFLEIALSFLTSGENGMLAKMSNELRLDSPAIVGEAKTYGNQATKQLEKYLSTGYFNKAYEIYDMEPAHKSEAFSLFYFDGVQLKEHIQHKMISTNDCEQQLYFDWIEQSMKYYLLANLSKDDFIKAVNGCAKNETPPNQSYIQKWISEHSLAELSTIVDGGNNGVF